MQSNNVAAKGKFALKALVVGRSPDGCSRLAESLTRVPCRVQCASSCRDALALLMEDDVAVILTDTDLCDGNWKTLVEEARRLRTPPNVIVVSDLPDWRLWADVLTSGGFDLLSPPSSTETLVWIAQSACQRWQRAREIDDARRKNALIAELHY